MSDIPSNLTCSCSAGCAHVMQEYNAAQRQRYADNPQVMHYLMHVQPCTAAQTCSSDMVHSALIACAVVCLQYFQLAAKASYARSVDIRQVTLAAKNCSSTMCSASPCTVKFSHRDVSMMKFHTR